MACFSIEVRLQSFHPLRGDPALKGRVFQTTDGAEYEARPPTAKIPGLKAWVHRKFLVAITAFFYKFDF